MEEENCSQGTTLQMLRSKEEIRRGYIREGSARKRFADNQTVFDRLLIFATISINLCYYL